MAGSLHYASQLDVSTSDNEAQHYIDWTINNKHTE